MLFHCINLKRIEIKKLPNAINEGKTTFETSLGFPVVNYLNIAVLKD